jgi:N-acetylglucosaminyldiphosphoundecaprenol N-acetyl-beta-D-mannosaminyltransferase
VAVNGNRPGPTQQHDSNHGLGPNTLSSSGPARPATYHLLGLPVSTLSFAETLRRLLEAPGHGEKLRVHFCALHTVVQASKDEAFRDLLAGADILAPDGTPLVWLGRSQGLQLERVCGPDTMLAVLRRAQGGHFFYGSTPDVLADLTRAVQSRIEGVRVVGAYSPPFRPLTEAEVSSIAATINAARPDYVWVGLGSPKQDRWLAGFRPLLDAPVLLAVGAAFDMLSGRVQRAPVWAQRHGLEWAFRIKSEPRRLAGRYLSGGLQLAGRLAADRARRWWNHRR